MHERTVPAIRRQAPQNPAGGIIAPTPDLLNERAGITVFNWYSDIDAIFHAAGGPYGSALPQGQPLSAALQVIHPEDRQLVRRSLEETRDTGTPNRFRFRASPDRTIEALLVASCFRDPGGQYPGLVQIITEDMSRLAQAERALGASEEQYRQAIALSPEIPWMADAKGRITEIGPRWTALTGLSVDEGFGEGWLQALHPDDRAQIVGSWGRALATGEPVDVEYRVRTAEGDYRWMRARAASSRNAAGEIERWYGTLEDVHSRRSAVLALQESEEFARSILESGSVAMEVLDLTGSLTYMNRPALTLMEVDDFEPLLGTAFTDVWPEGTRPLIAEMIEKARHGEIMRQVVFGPTARGNSRWWDLTLAPVRNAEGKVSRLIAVSQDVTAARANQIRANEALERLSDVLESTLDNVISLDREWRVTYCNRHAIEEFPFLADSYGKPATGLIDEAAARPFLKRVEEVYATGNAVTFEEFLATNGKWYELHVESHASGVNIFFRDITARRLSHERVTHLARHDALTGLSNRLHFREEFTRLLSERRADQIIGVMILDLDDFKLVNDSLGHMAGDVLLGAVALRLQHACPNGVVARFGGDEFALLVAARNREAVVAMGHEVLNALSKPIRLGDDYISIGASMGLSIAPDDGAEPEIALQCADMALYQAKTSGGHGLSLYEESLGLALKERREMKRDLSQAIARGELRVAYEPQFEVSANRLVGFEALVRWTSPIRGEVPPDVFIPLAETSSLINDIGRFVIETAARVATTWPEHVRLAVNLSPAQFRFGRVEQVVGDALAASGLAPDRLEVEITESVLLDEESDALETLSQLRERGIRVALDDFGTGYASLSYLQRFRFDKIKVDRSFVADLPGSAGASAIISAIVALSRAFGSSVTAEGVETWEQLLSLTELGISEAQGFLFSRPLPAPDAARLIATQRAADGPDDNHEALKAPQTGTDG